MNNVNLIGRLVRNPELKKTTSGISVCSITIAINRKYIKDGQERQADFINLVAWRNNAETICKYFEKGQMIGINGCIQTRNYQDADGNKRIIFEVLIHNIYFTGSYNKSNGEIQTQDFMNTEYFNSNENDFIELTNIDDSDLPF